MKRSLILRTYDFIYVDNELDGDMNTDGHEQISMNSGPMTPQSSENTNSVFYVKSRIYI